MGFELISWQGWGVTGSIAALLILFTTILLWLLPFPSRSIRIQLQSADDREDLRGRLGAISAFSRYKIAIWRFSRWLHNWFGASWNAQAFERCVAIAFVFPVALFLGASVLSGYKNGKMTTGELLFFLLGVVVLAFAVRWLFHFLYWTMRRAWGNVGGDAELAEIVARVVLGAFAVVFAFAIAFTVASSVAGQFTNASTVLLAIAGGFAFAFTFALAYAFAGIWAFLIALLIVTVLALVMAKQFAFFLLLFFIILPVLNAVMDWLSWAMTRLFIRYVYGAPDGAPGVLMVLGLFAVNIAVALTFVMALAVLLPIGLEAADLLLSVFGREPFEWRHVAAQAVNDPWNEGLFVTGMLLTPLVPTIASMTIGLAALVAPFTPGSANVLAVIPADSTISLQETETKIAVRGLLLARLWYIPALLIALAVYALIWLLIHLTAVPVADFLHSLALCSTSWSPNGQCPWM